MRKSSRFYYGENIAQVGKRNVNIWKNANFCPTLAPFNILLEIFLLDNHGQGEEAAVAVLRREGPAHATLNLDLDVKRYINVSNQTLGWVSQSMRDDQDKQSLKRLYVNLY